MTPLELDRKAKRILARAKKLGLEQNYLFVTSFDRYQTQVKVLMELEKVFQEEGVLVTKEYVKGRGNIYIHPAVKEYNNTVSAANNTAGVLIKIIRELVPESEDKGDEFDDF